MARDAGHGRVAGLATLPNVVSLSRLPMAAAFPFLTGVEERVLLIAAAAATDFLDGYLARIRGAATRLGALLDPVADRCFVLVAVGVLWYESALTPVATVILVARDLAVTGAFVVTRFSPRLRRVPFMARPAGKVVTALQLSTLAATYLAPGLVATCVALVAVASTVAIVDYSAALWKRREA
jgi:CDP-diacylglycerol--glycerol-3-phosphate 3-phosphatidyltransferase/cardiolipin synthase